MLLQTKARFLHTGSCGFHKELRKLLCVANELILLLTAVVSAVFVFTAWRFGKERLYSAIIVFLILIASLGGKIVTFAGHPTNTGNIFYASVFLATYFLIERYGKREGIRSIWIGVVWVVFFLPFSPVNHTPCKRARQRRIEQCLDCGVFSGAASCICQPFSLRIKPDA